MRSRSRSHRGEQTPPSSSRPPPTLLTPKPNSVATCFSERGAQRLSRVRCPPRICSPLLLPLPPPRQQHWSNNKAATTAAAAQTIFLSSLEIQHRLECRVRVVVALRCVHFVRCCESLLLRGHAAAAATQQPLVVAASASEERAEEKKK